MQYLGGKSRIAGAIANIINEIPRRKIQNSGPDRLRYISNGGGQCFVSLFCGSCAVESKVMGFDRKILNDKHAYLEQCWYIIQCWLRMKLHKTKEDKKK